MARRGFTWTNHQLDKLNKLQKRVMEFTASVFEDLYVITGFYADTEWGREMYRVKLSKIEETVKLYCRAWTAQGYPISLNDFEIDIQQF